MSFLSTDAGWLNASAILRIDDAIPSEDRSLYWHKVHYYMFGNEACEAWALAEDVERFLRTENNNDV